MQRRFVDYPVRVSDIDIFDHMNNSVYWSVVEDYLLNEPELLRAPLRVTIEHDAPVALGDKLEIITHVHPPGSTDKFGPDLADRTVRTLTYAVGDVDQSRRSRSSRSDSASPNSTTVLTCANRLLASNY